MKQVRGVTPFQFQAWVGLASVVPLTVLTIALEQAQVTRSMAAGWPFVAAVLFSAIVVSLLTHTLYYGLILRYPANLIAPLMVLNPLMTVVLGIFITQDPFDARKALGTALALTGVLLVSLNRTHAARLWAWIGHRRG
jgi:drug/metabolite transporter (DMT)-like permease